MLLMIQGNVKMQGADGTNNVLLLMQDNVKTQGYIYFMNHWRPYPNVIVNKSMSMLMLLLIQGNVKMHGVDGTTNVFVKEGNVDMQVGVQNVISF